MTVYTLHKEQFLTRPLAEVFAFFERPDNLATITPPWLGFRILTPPPMLMKKGAVLEYSVRVMGLPMRWKSLISVYDPPHRFVDEQLRGPYAFWHHTHSFSQVDGGTLIRDRVDYAMPFGVIGRILQRWVVKRQLEEIFAYRASVIDRMFGGEEFQGDQMSGGDASRDVVSIQGGRP